LDKRTYLRRSKKRDQKPLHEINEAALDSTRAKYLTHRLYRYPASMSPMITRALIESYSNKGDLLLDPFCGGGTSAVEALCLGRSIICSDLSPLACFITRAKATTLIADSVNEFDYWCKKEAAILEKYRPKKPKPLEVNGKHYSPLTYSTLIKLMKDTDGIRAPSMRILAKVVVLNVARRSIDGRSRIIPFYQISQVFKRVAQEVLSDIKQYYSKDRENDPIQISSNSIRVINCDARKLASRLSKYRNKIKLVVTSPPYPGVHVLYNRWQVHGRRETDLPFRLLGFNSEPPASFYTLGTRNSQKAYESYQKNMETILRSIHELLAPCSILAQVIAFPKNDGKHIGEYEDLMNRTGFKPVQSSLEKIQRGVPNRRWYTQLDKKNRQPIEHVFLHRKASLLSIKGEKDAEPSE